ncbi:MAG: 4-hydroxy-tetrahydrodipicolinate synthase, partial [Bifidobacteriales bacterium]|nr:4-hydroxy-tetrahydrodipicolinate synthase [Bifidobacteriales bacterium]
AGVLDSTTMRLPNLGPGKDQLIQAEKGMKAAGLMRS